MQVSRALARVPTHRGRLLEDTMKRIFLTLLAAVAVLAAACQLSGTTTPGPQPVGSPTAAGPTAASATAANPQALTIKWPAPGEGVEASPLLQWDDFPGAAHYQVTLLDSASKDRKSTRLNS